MQKIIYGTKYFLCINIFIAFLFSYNSEILEKTFSNFSDMDSQSSHTFFLSINSENNLYYGSVIKISDNLNLQGSILPEVKDSISFYYNFGISYKAIQDILNRSFFKTEILINMLKFDTANDIKWFHSSMKGVYRINENHFISSSINYAPYQNKALRFLNICWGFSINDMIAINLGTRILKDESPTKVFNLNIKL
tara:strand:+ start:364 stop:948 length:585 start_codon:yes stop_codon:yes gene_type:complete